MTSDATRPGPAVRGPCRPRRVRLPGAVPTMGGALIALLTTLLIAGCSSGGAGRSGVGTPGPRAAVVTASPSSAAPASTAGAAPGATVAIAATPLPAIAASGSPPVRANPCARNTARRFVRVSLRAQHLWMCAGRTPAYSTPITSGMAGEYTGTPTGRFEIQGLDRHTVLTLNTGRQYDVQYWIPFSGPLFGFHDAPWQTFPFGSPRYRTDGSHGCVHMPLKAIAFLYRWADVGTPVAIA